jgi:hypothetical protein
MQYAYEELIEGLEMGGEIEFTYRNTNYYIGRGTGRYMFWEFNNPASEIVGEDIEGLLSKVKIEGKSIKELWGLIEINVFY